MNTLQKLKTEQEEFKDKLRETNIGIISAENRADTLNVEILHLEKTTDSIGVKVVMDGKSEEDCLELHRRLLDCRALHNIFLRATGSLENQRKELSAQIRRLVPGIIRAESRMKYDTCMEELFKDYDKDKLEIELRDLRVPAGVDVHQYRSDRLKVLQEHDLDPMEKFFKQMGAQEVA